MSCPECAELVEHCHGTLVRHADGGAECTNPACQLPDAGGHELVLACTAVGCTCTGTGAVNR